MCSISRGRDQFKNLCKRYGLKFVLKLKSMIPEIRGYWLAEGSGLSVSAPRKVQIFFQVNNTSPLSEEDPKRAHPASTSRPSYIMSDSNCPIKIAYYIMYFLDNSIRT